MAGLKVSLLCFYRRTQRPTWPSTLDYLIQNERPRRNLHFLLSLAKKSKKRFCFFFLQLLHSICFILQTTWKHGPHFLLQENSSAPLRPRFRTNSVWARCQWRLWPGGPWWWSRCVELGHKTPWRHRGSMFTYSLPFKTLSHFQWYRFTALSPSHGALKI